jgi:hypothetical protein
MKYIKNINEKNIAEAIDYYHNVGHDYVETYQKIKDNLQEGKYNSIQSNYIALFLHKIIKNKIDINEFDDVIQTIYKDNVDVEPSFSRFFGLHSCDISLKNYLELQKPGVPESEKNYSIWNELSYFFYDIKNDNFALNESRVPYLVSICKYIPEDSMYSIYSGGFVPFCLMCIDNLDDLQPILKVVQNNTAFELSAGNNYKDFLSSFMRIISDRCYEMDEEKRANTYEQLSGLINNFEEVFLDRFIKYKPTDKFNKLSFDLGLVKFMNIVGDEKIICHINKVFQEALAKELDENNTQKNPFSIKSGLATEIGSSFEVSFLDKNYEVNYDYIDSNKNIFDNFVYLKLLELDIRKGKKPYVNEELRNYIKKEIAIDEASSFPELSFSLETKKITTYLDYLSINEILPEKKESKNRLKI